MRLDSRIVPWSVLVTAAAMLLAPVVHAIDGVIEINQARALAGAGTDLPGFPVTIDQPGSYRLTSDLDSPSTGIEIVVGGVSLDLNGFSVRCDACQPGSRGIDGAAQDRIKVENGAVRDFPGIGLNLGSYSIVRELSVSGGGDHGVVVAAASILTDVSSSLNSGTGIQLGDGCTLTSATARGNGIDGVIAANGASLSSVTASSNTGAGIRADRGSSIIASAADSNTGVGFVLVGAALSGSASRLNSQQGVTADASSVIGNAISDNLLDGIFASGGSQVAENTVVGNLGDGIETENAAVVRDNSLSANAGFGIRIGVTFMTPGAYFRGNSAWGNQAGGFTGSGVDQGGNSCVQGAAPSC